MGSLRGLNLGNKRPLRVAAYCRISYEEEEEESGSYANQRAFFKSEIDEHPDWELAGIFGDYNKTGTQIKGRTGFKRMMKKADEGKIDYIITKSIARFARSATDTLYAVRHLNKMGIGVYFLNEELDTQSMISELILSILSSIAEMESATISENVKLTFDAMNEKGTPLIRARYGYRKVGTEWVIVPEQARRVRIGFLMAANGYSFKQIADRLNIIESSENTGREWDGHMVKAMLMSEVYIGDLRTNKTTIIRDKLGKRCVPNKGIVDAFYIDHHHAPIVGRELFDQLNQKIARKGLAGQRDYKGCSDLQELARKDRLLMKYAPALLREEGGH